MTIDRRSVLAAALSTCAPAAFAQTAAPQFPADSIRLVVPYPAGGTFDIVGRMFASALSAKLGKPAIVDNRPGAASVLGANVVAQSRPDGQTLLVLPNSTLTIIPYLYEKLPYDPASLDAMGLLATAQFVVAANSRFGPSTVQELVALARKEPGKLSYGSFGRGTTSHLSGELLNQMAGTSILHVPYRGSAPGLADLLGGTISVMFDAIPAVLPHVKAGTLKALAVTGSSRSPLLPEVPTVAESGFPGYRVDGWLGIAAPAGLPPATRDLLVRTMAEVAREPGFQKQLRDVGMEPVDRAPADMGAFLADETARYRSIISKGRIRLD